MNIQQHEAEVIKAFINGGHPKMALLAMLIKRSRIFMFTGIAALALMIVPVSAWVNVFSAIPIVSRLIR